MSLRTPGRPTRLSPCGLGAGPSSRRMDTASRFGRKARAHPVAAVVIKETREQGASPLPAAGGAFFSCGSELSARNRVSSPEGARAY